MNLEELRDYCLEKVGANESFPFDENTLVFKVISKMFALIPLEKGDRIVLKCDPERSIDLREKWEEISPAWHMNKTHWNAVGLNGRIPSALIKELIDHSYALVKRGLKKAEKNSLEEMVAIRRKAKE